MTKMCRILDFEVKLFEFAAAELLTESIPRIKLRLVYQTTSYRFALRIPSYLYILDTYSHHN